MVAPNKVTLALCIMTQNFTDKPTAPVVEHDRHAHQNLILRICVRHCSPATRRQPWYAYRQARQIKGDGTRMPRGPKGEKRPANAIGNAIMIGRIATGEMTT